MQKKIATKFGSLMFPNQASICFQEAANMKYFEIPRKLIEPFVKRKRDWTKLVRVHLPAHAV